MKNFTIYRPFFDKSLRSEMENDKEYYALNMMRHLQAVSDWQQTLHSEESEGWGVMNGCVIIHKDGRVANLPDPCPIDALRRESREREAAWLRKRLAELESTNQ